MKPALAAGVVGGILALGIAAAVAQTMKQEPPAGALPCGQAVLVDDGTCGKGKIKKVVGGCDIGRGAAAGAVGRRKSCVKR